MNRSCFQTEVDPRSTTEDIVPSTIEEGPLGGRWGVGLRLVVGESGGSRGPEHKVETDETRSLTKVVLK